MQKTCELRTSYSVEIGIMALFRLFRLLYQQWTLPMRIIDRGPLNSSREQSDLYVINLVCFVALVRTNELFELDCITWFSTWIAKSKHEDRSSVSDDVNITESNESDKIKKKYEKRLYFLLSLWIWKLMGNYLISPLRSLSFSVTQQITVWYPNINHGWL